jgi:NADH dehydrogenase/NADH:ubiquinone oxidoreductase subunit G
MCDEGRLSYKSLQENRQKKILSKEKEILETEAVEAFQRLLKIYKMSVTVLIDANLYTEEIEAIVDFSKKIGAKIHAPLDSYIDESFQDDMLRSANRAANSKTIEILNIDTTLPSKSGLLINFNHPQTFESDALVNFSTHQIREGDLILPIAGYAESSGHITNEDGISQYCEQALHMNDPAPTVIEWLEKVGS